MIESRESKKMRSLVRVTSTSLCTPQRNFSMSSMFESAVKKAQDLDLNNLDLGVDIDKKLIDKGADQAINMVKHLEKKSEEHEMDVSVSFSVGLVSVTFQPKKT